jgi:hypothetical protein
MARRCADPGIRGDTWIAAGKGLEGAVVRGLFPLGTVLYASSASGLFRSIDRGGNWIKVMPAMDPGFFDMAGGNDTLFGSRITSNLNSALYRPTDNGLSWKSAPAPEQGFTWVSDVTLHAGYVFLSVDSDLFRAKRDLSGWTRIKIGSGDPHVRSSWSDGVELYVDTDAGIRHSPDAGETWIDSAEKSGPPI